MSEEKFSSEEMLLIESGFHISSDKQNAKAGWYEKGSNEININIFRKLVKKVKEEEKEKWIEVVEKLKKERIEKRRAIIRKHLVVEEE